MAKLYRLGKETFETKGAVTERVSAILNAGLTGSEVTGKDALILFDLLALRTDKVDESALRNVVGFERGMQPGPLSRTKCFWVIFKDGTKLDFSVYKAIRLLKPS